VRLFIGGIISDPTVIKKTMGKSLVSFKSGMERRHLTPSPCLPFKMKCYPEAKEKQNTYVIRYIGFRRSHRKFRGIWIL